MNEDSMRLSFDLHPSGKTSSVELEGVDISAWVKGVTIRAGVGELSRVTLDLIRVDVDVDVTPDIIDYSNWPDPEPDDFDEDGNAHIG